MSKIIRNGTRCDIIVQTPLGAFVFGAGKSVELADDRAEAAQKAGKWYFLARDLIAEDTAPAKAQDETDGDGEQGGETPAPATGQAPATAADQPAKPKKGR